MKRRYPESHRKEGNCPQGHSYNEYGYARPDSGLVVCRECNRIRQILRAYSNREAVNAQSLKWYHDNVDKVKKNRRLLKYGISELQYDLLYARQWGECAVCHIRPKEWLCVDHNHETGEIRGLLCKLCNLHVGEYETMGLESIIKYLEEYP